MKLRGARSVIDCRLRRGKHGASGDLASRARRPRSMARRHAGARRWRHGATSAAVTRRAREQHARARAGCVITVLPLAAAAAPPRAIGRPRPRPAPAATSRCDPSQSELFVCRSLPGLNVSLERSADRKHKFCELKKKLWLCWMVFFWSECLRYSKFADPCRRRQLLHWWKIKWVFWKVRVFRDKLFLKKS